jgi:apolipoprotein N-acyltransferase
MSYHGFNSAVLVDKTGQITATYDKMHRVVFGEYIPFASWFPFLYRLTPITGSIVAGAGATAMRLGDQTTISPDICYETVVPHLIAKHLNQLATVGIRPNVLLNLTNDAWFWGSSELDMHLACGVFRAVETRTPLLIAANGGLSAYVDQLGHIRQVTPRQQTATLLVDLENVDRPLSPYTRFGDWFAEVCVVCCVILALAAARPAARPSSEAAPRG